MAREMKMAESKDIDELITFRWERAFANKDYYRKDMRPYKRDFRFFLKNELNKKHRCLYICEDEKILATIYWAVRKDNVSINEKKPFNIGYIRYFESVEPRQDELLNQLLEEVIAICQKENVKYLGSFYRDENVDLFLNHGFILSGDLLMLTLGHETPKKEDETAR